MHFYLNFSKSKIEVYDLQTVAVVIWSYFIDW